MKPAQKWAAEYFGAWTINGRLSAKTEMDAETFADIVQEIQADAMDHCALLCDGEKFAPGKQTEWEEAYQKGVTDCELSILAALAAVREGAK